ncbi:hypothetical protein pb186bvf_014743 [Paramecium bursaria]
MQFITQELRVAKRDKLADMIQMLYKEMKEQQIMVIVKELETATFLQFEANSHLYQSRINQFIQLFNTLNLKKLSLVSQKVKAKNFNQEYLIKLITEKKLDQLEISMKSKQNKPYDPLKCEKKVKLNQLDCQVEIQHLKPKITNLTYFKGPQLDPLLEQREPISDDEEIIRMDDGLQGGIDPNDKCILWQCKQIYLIDKSQSTQITLLTQELPLYRSFCDKLEVKLFSAQQTIVYLQQKIDRKIMYGMVCVQNGSSEYIYNLSQKLIQKDMIIAQKYDDDNATFVLLNKKQLEGILKTRKITLLANKTNLLVDDWADEPYIKNWAKNIKYQDHDLYFLIYYKEVKQKEFRKMYQITMKHQKHYPQIEDYVREEQKQRDAQLLLQDFLKVDFNISHFDDQENVQEVQNQSQTSQTLKTEPIPPKVPQTNEFEIRKLTLNLNKEDYF